MVATRHFLRSDAAGPDSEAQCCLATGVTSGNRAVALFFRHLVVSFTRPKSGVPPDVEPLGLKCRSDHLGLCLVFAIVGEEEFGKHDPADLGAGII